MQVLATASLVSGPQTHMEIAGSIQCGDPRPWLFTATIEAGDAQPIAYRGAPVLYDVAFAVPGAATTYRSPDLADWSVQETMDRGTAWSVVVAPYLSDGSRRPLGVEMQWTAPPPGKLPVDLSVVYLSSQGEASFPVVVGGIVDSSERSIYPAAMTLQGLGKMGHYDRRRVTLKVPARSGWTHGRILIQLAQLAGIPAGEIKISPTLGAPRLKAYDIVDEDFPVVASEVAASCGYAVDFDRAGDLVAFELVPSGPAVARFTAASIGADGSAGIRTSGDVPTCLIFEGSGPDGQPSAAGRTRKIREVIIKGELILDHAAFQQDASPTSPPAGDLIPLGVTSPIVKQNEIKQITTIEEIYQDGCLEQRWTIEQRYFNPVAARYQQDTAGDPAVYRFCFIFDPDAEKDDAAQAYLWPKAKLVPTKIVAEGYRYDAGGRLFRVDTVYGAWRNREAAIKQRATPADDWEEQDFIDNQMIEAGGRGVVYSSEKWWEGRGFRTDYLYGWSATPRTPGADMPVGGTRVVLWSAVDTKQILNTADNYVRSEELGTLALGAKAGWEYLFQGGSEHAETEERPGYQAGGEITIYDAEEGGGLTVVTSDVLAEGKFGDQTIERGDGYLPASELCDGELSDRAANTLIEIKICAYEETHADHEERISNDFVETVGEARAFILREFARRVAPRITFAAPISAGIERGMVLSVYVPEADLEHEGWAEQVDSVAPAGGPAVTTVTLVTRID